ncbi:hypothetical protein GBA52_000565 [Prunus armeniaca]|nr:hypothetical protein GBA52_000565 [Prunus armeniaca]
MGKNEKTGLGRALVRQHNQMVQQTKEKGLMYKKQQKKVLESVTEVSDIDAIIEQADEADRLFSINNPTPNLLIDLDGNEISPEQRREQQRKEEALHAGSLRVPRRPPWTPEMSVEQLDANESQAFLTWRRSLARLEENDKLLLTPFEKNLDIWRQLWRVVERSDLLVMVVDARDPLFYRCPDLEVYAREVDEHKRTMLLVNKADLLPLSVRLAKAASAAAEGKDLSSSWKTENSLQESEDPDTKIYGRIELLTRLQSEAEEIVKLRRKSGSSGQKKTGVTSTPGKTKHFQTLIMSDELTLCDCPGLVFPSFSSSRHEMIASGVLPIDRMTENREAVQVVANRVPRHVIEEVYRIDLPKPKSYELQSRPPLAAEFMRAYCASRGYVASSGLPDETRAARQILKDYIDGKLPHYQMPPGMTDEEDVVEHSLSEQHESDASDNENPADAEVENVPELDHALDDLNSFDIANGLATKKKVTVKKPTASHKQHKKPQRKKDRTWRVGNDGGDGMPVARCNYGNKVPECFVEKKNTI